eukprot:tig00021319_g20235.t1
MEQIAQLKTGYLADPLREGFSSVKAECTSVHPVAVVQKTWRNLCHEQKQAMLSNVYGAQFPLRQQMEQKILSQFHRLPGLQSSFVALDTMLGVDDDLTFEDILGDPANAEQMPPSLHSVMEAHLGIKMPRLC